MCVSLICQSVGSQSSISRQSAVSQPVQVVRVLTSCPCPLQSHRKVGGLWREAGLSWSHFLPEDEDVQTFISEQVSHTHTHTHVHTLSVV